MRYICHISQVPQHPKAANYLVYLTHNPGIYFHAIPHNSLVILKDLKINVSQSLGYANTPIDTGISGPITLTLRGLRFSIGSSSYLKDDSFAVILLDEDNPHNTESRSNVWSRMFERVFEEE